MHALQDGWYREINRAVRNFASSDAGNPERVRLSLETLLREMADALDADCGALLEMNAGNTSVSAAHVWCRPVENIPFATADFEAVVGATPFDDDVVVRDAMADSDDAAVNAIRTYLRQSGMHLTLLVPVALADRASAVWVFGSFTATRQRSDALIEHLQTMGALVCNALQAHRAPAIAFRTDSTLTSVPPRPCPATARHTFSPHTGLGFSEIVGGSAALKAALASLEKVVETDCSVLLLGETGTGKELFARALHAHGPRRSFPMVAVNCAALPATLIESELFGHQRGAFTGAVSPRQGRFELANRGTLFLDEIGDLPLELQAKLLRVLQEGSFERVGSSQSQNVDVRIIAATHQNLPRAVAEGAFRADLYYRLNVFPIRLPPLRDRREDIPDLVWSIVDRRQQRLRRHIKKISDETIGVLCRHSWPGNIRELENVIERALIHSPGDTLMLPEASLESPDGEAVPDRLVSVERAHIEGVLRECGWRINGFGNAAERLGLHPNTLRFRMKKLGINRGDSGSRMRSPRAFAS